MQPLGCWQFLLGQQHEWPPGLTVLAPVDCVLKHLHYYGHSSKQVGVPTVNFPEQVVDNLPADIPTRPLAFIMVGPVLKVEVSLREQ